MKRVTITAVTVLATLTTVLMLGSLQPTQPVLNVLASCGLITDGMGCGTVVAIGPDLLVTAGHCIDRPGTWVEIGERRYEIVEKWRAPAEDIGFLKIDPNGVPLIPVRFGQMPAVLDTVYLVGSPYGPRFQNSVMKGVVSHLDRDVYDRDDLIQTDAEGAPGCSGGPLLDEQGRIVGICVAGPNPGGGVTLCEPVTDIQAALREFQNRPATDPNTDTEETRDAEQGDQ